VTGCSEESNPAPESHGGGEEADTAAVIFGPSLTELFYISGAWSRVAGVDRFSTWPPQVSELAVTGDYLTPSLEMITALGATSIHVIGTNQSLIDLAGRLNIPCYQYSFDRLEDVYESCDRIEDLYSEADLSSYTNGIELTIDSLAAVLSADSLRVMVVVYLDGDGAITLAGGGTFYSDILKGTGCVLSAPETGTYPAVSVEGVISLDPDRVIILDACGTGESMLGLWRNNGLDDSNTRVLSEDYVLIPGARLHELVIGIAQCLN
jgi:iron complex transport system substrate-binding protein